MGIDELYEHIESNDGWCVTCGDFTVFGGVEPDARNYHCPQCDTHSLFGAEEAGLIMMVVPLDD